MNYEALEDAALFGLEESLANGGEVSDDGWFREGQWVVGDWQGPEIAEALYMFYKGF